MSLEAAIGTLTIALNRNSDLLEKSEAGRAKAIEAANALTTGASAGSGGGRPPGSKNKKTEAAKDAAKPPTEADVRAHFGAYMEVPEPTEREKRKQHVIKILAHFGAKKAGEIAEGDRAAAMQAVNDHIAGNTPSIFGESSDEAEEGNELL
jgi:hypothetical protein